MLTHVDTPNQSVVSALLSTTAEINWFVRRPTLDERPWSARCAARHERRSADARIGYLACCVRGERPGRAVRDDQALAMAAIPASRVRLRGNSRPTGSLISATRTDSATAPERCTGTTVTRVITPQIVHDGRGERGARSYSAGALRGLGEAAGAGLADHVRHPSRGASAGGGLPAPAELRASGSLLELACGKAHLLIRVDVGHGSHRPGETWPRCSQRTTQPPGSSARPDVSQTMTHTHLLPMLVTPACTLHASTVPPASPDPEHTTPSG